MDKLALVFIGDLGCALSQMIGVRCRGLRFKLPVPGWQPRGTAGRRVSYQYNASDSSPAKVGCI